MIWQADIIRIDLPGAPVVRYTRFYLNNEAYEFAATVSPYYDEIIEGVFRRAVKRLSISV